MEGDQGLRGGLAIDENLARDAVDRRSPVVPAATFRGKDQSQQGQEWQAMPEGLESHGGLISVGATRALPFEGISVGIGRDAFATVSGR